MGGLKKDNFSSSRLNLVTMELSGQLLLMGYRIFEKNNNDQTAVYEEGSNIQEVEAEVEEEQEDGEESEDEETIGGSILTRGLKFSSVEDFLSFMGGDMSEVDSALQPSAVEVNSTCAEEEADQGKREGEGSEERFPSKKRRLASQGKVKEGDGLKVAWSGRFYSCKVVMV